MLDILLQRVPGWIKKKHIAIIMGGPSQERENSLRSGEQVRKALKNLQCQHTTFDFTPDIFEDLKRKNIDLVFLATHGVPGEDGSIQGGLDAIGIPYTGAGVQGSVMTINKLVSKSYLNQFGIETAPWVPINKQNPIEITVQQCSIQLGFPCVIKPVLGGSSIGVRLCKNKMELRTSLEHLYPIHRELFAEKYIEGREVSVSVLEDSRSLPFCLPILELGNRTLFYDKESKREDGSVDFLVPAKLPQELAERCYQITKNIHHYLLLRDFSRSDFIIQEDQKIVYLESNSIPGMTNLSDLPAQAKAQGMVFEEVVLNVLMSLMRRHYEP